MWYITGMKPNKKPRRSRATNKKGKAPARKAIAQPVMHPNTEAVIAEVFALIKEQGISLNKAANIAGIAKGAVSRIKNRQRSPQLDTIAALCECIGRKVYIGR